jgi:Rrf2 family protein
MGSNRLPGLAEKRQCHRPVPFVMVQHVARLRSDCREVGSEVSMKLTRAASYALHAVAFMAAQKQYDKPVASHHIAQARGIPERFLLKVLKPLVSVRILLSIKGPNGGYRLARQASDISMLEILEAVDGPIRGQAPFSEEGDGALNTKLELICKQNADQVRKYLEKVKLSELVTGRK